MKRSLLAAVLLSLSCAPLSARINMLEPWSPGLDFRVPKDTWNHDVHMRLGFGRKSADIFALGYLLSVPVAPEWEVGGGMDYLSVSRPNDSNSGLSDISLGAKYKMPKALLPPALEIIGEAGLTLPTGDPDKGLGAGGLGLFLGGGLQGAMAETVTGYTHLGLRTFLKGQDWDQGDVVEYQFGVKYRVNPEWIAAADVRGFNQGRPKYKGRAVGQRLEETYLAPGAIYRPKKAQAEFLGTLLLGLTSTSYDFGLQLSAKF